LRALPQGSARRRALEPRRTHARAGFSRMDPAALALDPSGNLRSWGLGPRCRQRFHDSSRQARVI